MVVSFVVSKFSISAAFFSIISAEGMEQSSPFFFPSLFLFAKMLSFYTVKASFFSDSWDSMSTSSTFLGGAIST